MPDCQTSSPISPLRKSTVFSTAVRTDAEVGADQLVPSLFTTWPSTTTVCTSPRWAWKATWP